MKREFIEEIPKTQDGLYTKDGFKPYKGKFFYSPVDFIGKHIKISFTVTEIFDMLQYGCEPIKSIIKKTVHNKMKELGHVYGLLIDYKVAQKELLDDRVIFKIKITKCETDCG